MMEEAAAFEFDLLIPAWRDGRLEPVEKLEAHRLGLRHPAISVFLMDGDRTLIQRRALSKYHTPGLWANACCTHPFWREPAEEGAARRLGEELGVSGLALRARGEIEYRASVGGDMIEHEVVALFVADVDAAAIRFTPNPDEVADVRWIALDDLRHEITETPERFTPWLRIYLERHGALLFGGGDAAEISRISA